MGRDTHKRPEVELTVEERVRLAEARAVVADLGSREPLPDQLTEQGYEMRQTRAEALRLTVTCNFGKNSTEATHIADKFFRYIWSGEVTE